MKNVGRRQPSVTAAKAFFIADLGHPPKDVKKPVTWPSILEREGIVTSSIISSRERLKRAMKNAP